MSEQLGNEFVPYVPEFDGGPQGLQFQADTAPIGGAAAPFGFSAEQSTNVTNTLDLGVRDGRTLKGGDDNTAVEYESF